MKSVMLIPMCAALSVAVAHGLLTTTGIHEKCTSSSECPTYATCRPSACDGFHCLCYVDYIATGDRSRCVKAKRIGEQCDIQQTRCISQFAACRNGVCECFDGFAPTKDGRCKRRDTNFVGEPCGICEYPALCGGGVCQCAGEHRPLTIEEFWVDPLNILQCRPRDYALEICNGTRLKMAISNQEETVIPRDRQQTGDLSREMSENLINDKCIRHNQCPDNAQCRPNSCDGFICLCDENFIFSSDRTVCKRAIRVGGVCDSRTDICVSPFATCLDNICTCKAGFIDTADGRCTTVGDFFLGGGCISTEECAYPSECVDGVCACVKPQRNLTADEVWSDPTLTIQCRPNYYSQWKCDGSILKVPRQLKGDIPLDIELELKVLAHEHHDYDDHGLQSHDDNVDSTHVRPDADNKAETFLIPINVAGVMAVAGVALIIGLVCRKRRQRRLEKAIPDPEPSIPTIISSPASFGSEDHYAEVNNGILKIPRPSISVRDQYSKDACVHSEHLDSDYARCGARTCADLYTIDDCHDNQYGQDHILF